MYLIGDIRVDVYYSDYFADGVLDRIMKFAHPQTGEYVGYCMDYDCKLKLARYEKTEKRHDWFSFLSVDW